MPDLSVGNPAQPWVYSLTPANTEAEGGNTDVVTGINPLFGTLACTLFDLGATHSFVSSSFVKLCNLNMKPLEQVICVATPVGDTVTCRKYVEDCSIIVSDKTLLARLVAFEMLGFNVILGMDWRAKYGASIDCGAKDDVFRPPDAEEFKFCGSRVRATPLPLSATQAS